ncbi:MAG: tRNA lysidine(34) synthetase TilS [Alistipes sp.]|nr:tRNA lysidine(34) synthetase TilS [Alistipes sp.]MBQ6584538.1 tRNA lysidine(34) synthetase TilS [Alistipes sp.]
MKNRLLEHFERYNARHALFSHDDKILLTVSGGVDSMVMLALFVEAGYNIGVAHCNFSLRGAESDEDEATVTAEAAKYGVPFYNKRFDTQAEMERTGESMEMAARRLRYEWFEQLCEEHGYTTIAIAHHIDDSIETFFINLLRGTGLRGLTGITRQRGNIVRPLLFAERKEILEYAVAHKIPYREDSSNRSTKYLRNKIRLGLLPMIREINPRFTSIMRGNLYRLSDAQRFIEAGIAKIKEQVLESCNGIDRIHTSLIEPHFPQEFVIYEILNSVYGFKGDVVDELYKALVSGSSGKRFYAREHMACIDRSDIVISAIADDDPCQILVEREAIRSYCGNSVLYYEHTDIDNVSDYNAPQEIAYLDEQKLSYPLTLRRWQEGDSFIPFGMMGRKKVSDFLTDRKMSVVEKSRQFVLVSGEDIVWVVGCRIDDRYRVTNRTEDILKITKQILNG